MDDVQFNEEPQYVKRVSGSGPKPSLMSRLILAAGLANDEKGTQRVLLIVLFIVLAITAYVMWGIVQGTGEPEQDVPEVAFSTAAAHVTS